MTQLIAHSPAPHTAQYVQMIDAMGRRSQVTADSSQVTADSPQSGHRLTVYVRVAQLSCYSGGVSVTVHRGSWLHSRVTLGLGLGIFTQGQVAQLEPWLGGTDGWN